MKKISLHLSLCLATLVATVILSGCATTSAPETAETVELYRGMPTADLIAAFGEPKSVEPYTDDEAFKLWVYERKSVTTKMAATGVTEIPYIDPITGEVRSILDPSFSPETVTKEETLQFLVSDDTVLAWKSWITEDRDVSN